MSIQFHDSISAAFEEIFAPKSTLTLAKLLGRGYFPKELPPPFKAELFSSAMTKAGDSLPQSEFTNSNDKWCGFTSFSLARAGAIRRKLAILNPVAYFRLASEIIDNQAELFKLATPGVVSLSHPKIVPAGDRAITTHSTLGALPEARAKNRVGKRFVLRTDIANFYPSIYTHALDWAITGKAKAKKTFNASVKRLGKRIDQLVAAAQNGQTRGLPIGPDTSLLLAHVILAPIDKELKKAGLGHGFRFMDDYELVFTDRADAERALALLLSVLSDYELELNSLKTKIEELPLEIDNPAILNIKALPLRTWGGPQRTDLVSLFSTAFSLAKAYPDKPVLQYTVGKLRNSKIANEHADLVQDLVLQCATVEPGLWPNAIPLLRRLHATGKISSAPILTVIEITIRQQAPLGHSSEVAWCLWAALVFSLKLSKAAVKSVVRMEDDVCILLLLHAAQLGFAVIDKTSLKKIKSLVVRDQLYGEHWLLAYEAVTQEWIKPTGGSYLQKEPAFKLLQDRGVSFYDIVQMTDYNAINEEESEPRAFDYGNFEDIYDSDDEILSHMDDD